MQKEITFEDAKNIIETYGIDEDEYIMQHYHQFMNGNNDADDNTIESSKYFRECLKIIVAEGLKANPVEKHGYSEGAVQPGAVAGKDNILSLLKESNELLEAISEGVALDDRSGRIWTHWFEKIEAQVEKNNVATASL